MHRSQEYEHDNIISYPWLGLSAPSLDLKFIYSSYCNLHVRLKKKSSCCKVFHLKCLFSLIKKTWKKKINL